MTQGRAKGLVYLGGLAFGLLFCFGSFGSYVDGVLFRLAELVASFSMLYLFVIFFWVFFDLKNRDTKRSKLKWVIVFIVFPYDGALIYIWEEIVGER